MRITLPLILFALLQVGDVATTAYALQHGGMEANPFAAWIIANLGIAGLATLKLAAVTYAAAVGGACSGRLVAAWDFVIRGAGVLYALVVVSNLVVGGLI